MEDINDKLDSLGSAVIVGNGMVKRVRFAIEDLEDNHKKNMDTMTDPRLKSLHTLVFNKHLNNFEEIAKELEKSVNEYKEELENENEKIQAEASKNTDSQT